MNVTPSPVEDARVKHALDLLAPESPPDVDGAWLRQQRIASMRSRSVRLLRLPRILDGSARMPLAAAAASVLLGLSLFLTPVRSFAAQFLSFFRVQDFTPITINSLSEPLPDLSKFGDPPQQGRSLNLRPTQMASLSEASSAVGFTVQTPNQLPAGLGAQPSVIATTTGQTVAFTFRADKTRAYLDSVGRRDIQLPPQYDGATLQLHLEPAVELAYLPPGTSLQDLQAAAAQARRSGAPAQALSDLAKGAPSAPATDSRAVNALLNSASVLVVETHSPSVDATGVSPDDLRGFLLSLPIPADLKAQLQAIGDWRHTLPIPAGPDSQLHKVSVNGAPGLAGKNGPAVMVVWVNNGIVYGVTGTKLDEKSLLALASSVR